MKNIFILPTDKPSYLYKKSDGTLHISDLFESGNSAWKNQNIYITNSEEIKEGDWCVDDIGDVFKIEYLKYFKEFCKKIILTTDLDLIKDGVQAIDDEFLEWFVKNPSCEEVEVETFEVEDYVGFAGHTSYPTFHNEYRIIIPKEEQKQHLIDIMNDDEDLGLYNETFDEYLIRLKDRRTEDDYKYTDEDFEKYDEYIMDSWRCGMSVYKCLEFMYFAEKEIQPEQIWNEEKKKGIEQLIQDHKKETLEEAAERMFPYKMEEYDIFLMGAKWQQEQDAKDIQLLREEIGHLKRNKI